MSVPEQVRIERIRSGCEQRQAVPIVRLRVALFRTRGSPYQFCAHADGQGLTANCLGCGGGRYLCLITTRGFGFTVTCFSDDPASAMAFSLGSRSGYMGAVAATTGGVDGIMEGADVSNWRRCGHLCWDLTWIIAESIGAPKLAMGGALGRYHSATRSSANSTAPTHRKYRRQGTGPPFPLASHDLQRQASHAEFVPYGSADRGRRRRNPKAALSPTREAPELGRSRSV